MLLDLIAGVEREHHVRMATELVVRASTGEPPLELRPASAAGDLATASAD